MKVPTEGGRSGAKLAVRDVARIRRIAAAVRKNSRPIPLVLGGRDAAAAADAIASQLGLTLFRIDLSKVVSKYIGETEKNLANVLAGAEASGAILFFDEAEALFGKRSSVKDAHDRYSNATVNSLLRGLRSHDGLVIFVSEAGVAVRIKWRRYFSFHHFPPD